MAEFAGAYESEELLVPLTVGFVSKWYLALGLLDYGGPWLVLALLVSSLLAAVYVWRVVEVMYFAEAPEEAPTGEAPLSLLLPTWLLIGASIFFGIFATDTVGAASASAAQLLGVVP